MSGRASAVVHSDSSKSRRDAAANEWSSSRMFASSDIYFSEDAQFEALIPKPVPVETPAVLPPTPQEEQQKRGRKSKSQALEKLSNHVQESSRQERHSSSAANDKPALLPAAPMESAFIPTPSENPARKHLSKPRAPPLDLSSICTRAPINMPNRTDNRPFNISHCPIFKPTIEEFSKPIEYLEKVARSVSAEYGIVKIIPPDGWKPTFALNTETFHFKTRLQRLNSMEASARANLNFMEQLYVFHRQQPGPRVSIPIIDGKTVDLWHLRKMVHDFGGYSEVSHERKWAFIANALGLDPKSSSSTISHLRNAYLKIIAPFDKYLENLKINNVVSPSTNYSTARTDTSNASPSLSMSSRMGHVGALNDDSKDTVTMEQVRDASDKLNQALNPDGEDGAEAEMTDPNLGPMKRLLQVGEACEICHHDNEPHKIVLCDECDRAFHMACLTPPLTAVPRSDWICDGCIVSTGADYGFEVGQDHYLYTYRKRADEFKRRWLETHPLPSQDPTQPSPFSRGLPPKLDSLTPERWQEQLNIEDHIEREFWRLVESSDEVVEVEYGADLHSSKYGSGFASLERDPLDPYARDGWNLNNLPIMSGSLLRYIRSDIAGMTNPWLYAGMVFSTFAWHKEDHYTYSINYHHFGETKTWYGVPEADDYKLEAAMKSAAPELFEQQPDLMFQLVTLMSPKRLMNAGVRVAACDQRPGEFVITMPRSYHAGFNHGFNVCEAVNFCLPDWLPHGLACVQHYRELNKFPVFSHDELVCTIYMHEKNPRASRWLYPFFKEMVEREINRRDQARATIKDLTEVMLDEDMPEKEAQCVHCKCYCFLSQVVSDSSPQRATCTEHAVKVLGDMKKTLRIRFSDDDLRTFLKKVKVRADKVSTLPPTPDDGEARKSGRKRVPTAAALEAMGQDVVPLSQRRKLAHVEPMAIDA